MNRREERDMKRADRFEALSVPRLLTAQDESGWYAGLLIDNVFHAVGDWQPKNSIAKSEAEEYDAPYIGYYSNGVWSDIQTKD